MPENERTTSSSPSKPCSETRIVRLIVLAGLIGLFLVAFWMAMKSRRMLVGPVALMVDEQYLSFGEAWEQKDFKWIIPVENRSGKEKVVRYFASSCGCVSVEPKSVRIPPSGKVNVTLTFDLTKAFPARSDDGVQSLYVKVVPVLNNQVRPEGGWTFCGRVRRLATFTPASIQLWAGLYHGRTDIHRSVDVLLHVPAKKVVAKSSSPFLSTSLVRRALDRYQLDLVFSNQAPAGSFDHSVQLSITDEDGREKAGPKLEVKGMVNEEVEAIPGHVSFGAARVGTTLSENVHLKPGTKEGIRLVGVDNPCLDASVVQTNYGEEGISFRIVQHIKQAGQQSYIVSFRLESMGSNRRQIVVPVKVNYYGITPTKEQE